jgi:hypothetical protein
MPLLVVQLSGSSSSAYSLLSAKGAAEPQLAQMGSPVSSQ